MQFKKVPENKLSWIFLKMLQSSRRLLGSEISPDREQKDIISRVKRRSRAWRNPRGLPGGIFLGGIRSPEKDCKSQRRHKRNSADQTKQSSTKQLITGQLPAWRIRRLSGPWSTGYQQPGQAAIAGLAESQGPSWWNFSRWDSFTRKGLQVSQASQEKLRGPDKAELD